MKCVGSSQLPKGQQAFNDSLDSAKESSGFLKEVPYVQYFPKERNTSLSNANEVNIS